MALSGGSGMANTPVPRPGAEEQHHVFTTQEEAFLRHYSESLNRLEALGKAGFLPRTLPTMAQQQGLMQEASRIIAKAERMSLNAIASAIGADRLWLLAQRKLVCEDPQGHVAIKGLQLMARIHGVWEKEKGAKQQVAIIFGTPEGQKRQTQRTGLPFVIDAEYEDGGAPPIQ